MQYIELSPVAAFLLRVNIINAPAGLMKSSGLLAIGLAAGAVMIFTRPAGAVMIFTRSRNAAAGDNSMYWTLSPAQRLVKGRQRQTSKKVDIALPLTPPIILGKRNKRLNIS